MSFPILKNNIRAALCLLPGGNKKYGDGKHVLPLFSSLLELHMLVNHMLEDDGYISHDAISELSDLECYMIAV
jgi:hypothetical protein